MIPEDITDDIVDAVGEIVSLHPNAWDMVDPKELIAAAVNSLEMEVVCRDCGNVIQASPDGRRPSNAKTAPIADAPALLRELRKYAGLTELELAAKMLVSQPMVNKLERLTHNPTVRSVKAFARACGFDVELVATKRP